MASKIVEAAGGIVMRKGAGKRIAVVQRSKDDAWVLPRGKLKRNEHPVAGARREVIEETGHRVEVHEFLGAITYRAGGRPKVVQFWRMEAEAEASHELMPDIVTVEWLPLKAAIRRLSYPLEKLFLRHAAARALKKKRRAKSGKVKKRKSAKSKPGKSSAASKPVKTSPAKSKPGKAKTGAPAADKKAASKSRPKDKKKRKDKGKGRNKGKVKGKIRGFKNRPGQKKVRPAKARRKTRKAEAKPVTTLRGAALRSPAVRHLGALPQPAMPEPHSQSAAPSNERASAVTAAPEESKTMLQRMLGRLAG